MIEKELLGEQPLPLSSALRRDDAARLRASGQSGVRRNPGATTGFLDPGVRRIVIKMTISAASSTAAATLALKIILSRGSQP